MKLAISATNPCHLYPLAVECARLGALDAYYSGYPAWKLPAGDTLPLRTHSLRTNIVYALLKYAPEKLRPSSRTLFLWQDHAFDRWVGAHLRACDFIHAMPGQALHSFCAARRLGVKTVLNHATGPVREWVRIMAPEYARAGLRVEDACPYDDAYFAREEEEYALADYHCAASTVVRDQLIGIGIDPARIWVVPYGADPAIFNAPGPEPASFRIVFAGQIGLRKGFRNLLAALTHAARPDWRVDFYGAFLSEAQRDLDAYRGATPLHFHGPVSQPALATALRESSVLVLPSLEEGFGLVVPQALNCGCPALVSDRVGARDLLRARKNGSIIPAEDPHALAAELTWWSENPTRVHELHDWQKPTRLLLEFSQSAGASAPLSQP